MAEGKDSGAKSDGGRGSRPTGPPPPPPGARTRGPSSPNRTPSPPPQQLAPESPTARATHALPLGFADVARKPGPLGDVRYLVAALATWRRANKKLSELSTELQEKREQRATLLEKHARTALVDSDPDSSWVGDAQQQLVNLEEKRAKHDGAAAAADESATALQYVHAQAQKIRAGERAELEPAIAQLEDVLSELYRARMEANSKCLSLRQTILGLDERIAKEQDKCIQHKVASEAHDAAHARIASLSAERNALEEQVPPIAAELQQLGSQLDSLEQKIRQKATRLKELVEASNAAEELMAQKTALAREKGEVEKQAAREIVAQRQEALVELGETLHRRGSAPSEVAQMDRVIAHLREQSEALTNLVANFERSAMIRGGLWIALLLGTAAVAILMFS